LPSAYIYKEENKRKTDRCNLKPGACVLFKKSLFFGLIKPRTVKSAAILDMSLSGIRAQYNTTSKWSLHFDRVSIGTVDKKIEIDRVDCRVMSDCIVEHHTNGPYTRMCGIKFVNLSDAVKSKLSQIIETYGSDSLEKSKSWHKELV